jgi:hypothetical protein
MMIARRRLVRAVVIAGTLAGTSLPAQDLAGVWQGTFASELGTLRAVLVAARAEGSSWKVAIFSVDQSGFDHGIAASGVKLRESSITITFDSIDATFEGTVTHDGSSLSGKWSQNNESVPLTFSRATQETLWRDPLARTRTATNASAPARADASRVVARALSSGTEDASAGGALSFSALWISACGGAGAPKSDTGFVFGRVAHLLGVQPDTSDYVQAAWGGDRVPGDLQSDVRATISRAHLKEDGSYAICGVPTGRAVSLRVVRAGVNTPVMTTRVAESRIVRRDLTLATESDLAALDTVVAGVGSEPGATVTGLVIDALRHRVAGAGVHVRGVAASATTTDTTGRFVITGVPPGPRAVEISDGDRPILMLIDAYIGDTVAFVAHAGNAERAERVPMDNHSIVHGVVTDSARTPLEGVEVFVVNSGRTARTDRAGRFRIDTLVEGPTEVRAREIGWTPADTSLVLAPHADVSLNFRFRSRAAALDTVRIIAKQAECNPRDFEGFECRRKAGLGVFISPARVDSINPRYVADLFDGVAGFRRVGKTVLPAVGDRCVTTLINGHPAMPIEAMQLAQADARDVVAVEAYTDPKTYPEWYKMYSWMGEGGFKAKQCALIVLWTEGPPPRP